MAPPKPKATITLPKKNRWNFHSKPPAASSPVVSRGGAQPVHGTAPQVPAASSPVVSRGGAQPVPWPVHGTAPQVPAASSPVVSRGGAQPVPWPVHGTAPQVPAASSPVVSRGGAQPVPWPVHGTAPQVLAASSPVVSRAAAQPVPCPVHGTAPQVPAAVPSGAQVPNAVPRASAAQVPNAVPRAGAARVPNAVPRAAPQVPTAVSHAGQVPTAVGRAAPQLPAAVPRAVPPPTVTVPSRAARQPTSKVGALNMPHRGASPPPPPPAHHPSPQAAVQAQPLSRNGRVRYSSFLVGERSPSPISPTHVIRHLPFNSTMMDSGLVDSSDMSVADPEVCQFTFPKSTFRSLVKAIGEDYGDFRWEQNALNILQEVAEAYLEKFFAVANGIAKHRRRVTLGVEDLQMAVRLEELLSSKALK